MSGSLKNDNNTMSKSKFIKVVVSSEFADTKNFMMEVNSKVSTLKKEIFDRCGLENMEIYWKNGRDRIDIKVDGDLTAFLAKGNDTIFVKSPKIRTADDFALEQEYSEYARENQYY